MAVELAAAPIHGRERAKRARLAGHPLLAGCSPLTLRRVSAVADEIIAQPGDVLVGQGRHVFWFFLIHDGRADVVRDGRTVDQLSAGQYFGEILLERGRTQPVSVVATTPMRLFVIGSQRFVPLAHDLRLLRQRLGVAPDPPRRRRPLRKRAHQPPAPLPRRLVVVPPTRRRRRRPLIGIGVAAALGVAALYHPPVAVVAPGASFDVARDIAITGVPTTPVHGRYLLTSVDVARPTLLGMLAASFSSEREIVGAGRVTPAHGTSASARRQQRAVFRQSRLDAAAAAAHVLRLPLPAGDDGRAHLPFSVRFRARDVAGPSAGLVYAMAIADMLSTDDLARGRAIGATGEIDIAGNVGLVSYLGGKAAAVHRAGAGIFVVPGAQSYAATGRGIQVTGVSTLQEALAALLAP